MKLGKLSFEKGKVPECLKIVYIIAILKGSRSDESSPRDGLQSFPKCPIRWHLKQIFPFALQKPGS